VTTEISDITPAEEETPNHQSGQNIHSATVVMLKKVKVDHTRLVPELIPVLGSQPSGDVSHKPSGRLPLLSAGPGVTPRNP